MSAASADPLRVIAVEAPAFSADDAVRIAAEYYGLAVSARELLSERDRNYHLRSDDGREFVLKIASSAEDPLVTDFQVQALRHIEAQRADIATPRVVPALDGRFLLELQSGDGTNAARLVTWLPGILLAGQPLTTQLCRNLGIYAAKLGRALQGFEHPGSNPSLIWNMHEAARVREIAPYIPEPELRSRVIECLERFEEQVLPRFATLRTQVVHNDLNPENLLLDPDDLARVAGVIDFGDMTQSPLIVDVAVAASYMRELQGNPLARIAAFVAAYHSITPLERDEIDLICDLVQVRLATTVSVLQWRIADRGKDDPYLNNSVSAESTAAKFLCLLDSIPREHAQQTLRQACASTDAALARDSLRGSLPAQ
jgi:Ser/Thr protein kinase RdoA (MazF antagonist)